MKAPIKLQEEKRVVGVNGIRNSNARSGDYRHRNYFDNIWYGVNSSCISTEFWTGSPLTAAHTMKFDAGQTEEK